MDYYLVLSVLSIFWLAGSPVCPSLIGYDGSTDLALQKCVAITLNIFQWDRCTAPLSRN